MTTATKKMPKKGDTIFVAGIWSRGDGNSPQSVYTRKMIVQSWGKQQATFKDAATGEMLKHFGYPESFVFAWSMEELAPIVADVKAQLKKHHEQALVCMRSWFSEYGGRARADVLVRHHEGVQKVEGMRDTDPPVADYNELKSAVRAAPK